MQIKFQTTTWLGYCTRLLRADFIYVHLLLLFQNNGFAIIEIHKTVNANVCGRECVYATFM